MRITGHTLVKNEERFVWYSVMSVLPYLDELLLWDTGSTDGTKEVLKKIKEVGGEKVKLNLLGEVDPEEFAQVRQEMLNKTKTDWFLVVDGDEISWDDSVEKIVSTIEEEGNTLESIVVPTINLIGDIFHYMEEGAGQYRLAGRKGHLNLRAVNRNIPGIRSEKPHGSWGWVDEEGKMIQDRSPEKIKYVEAPYLHATFLQRAGQREKDTKVPKRKRKFKYEIGKSFPKDFYYPEVLFREKPGSVPSPWKSFDLAYFLRALPQTPLKKIRRRMFELESGY